MPDCWYRIEECVRADVSRRFERDRYGGHDHACEESEAVRSRVVQPSGLILPFFFHYLLLSGKSMGVTLQYKVIYDK
jgi:hypothetical protein